MARLSTNPILMPKKSAWGEKVSYHWGRWSTTGWWSRWLNICNRISRRVTVWCLARRRMYVIWPTSTRCGGRPALPRSSPFSWRKGRPSTVLSRLIWFLVTHAGWIRRRPSSPLSGMIIRPSQSAVSLVLVSLSPSNTALRSNRYVVFARRSSPVVSFTLLPGLLFVLILKTWSLDKICKNPSLLLD